MSIQRQETRVESRGTSSKGCEMGEVRANPQCRTLVARRSSLSSISAFTLVELLVVISIIGVLASLITVVAVNVLDKAAQTRVLGGINQIDLSMKNYKNKYGSYPPNMSDRAAMRRHFKKAFPRIHPDDLLLVDALAGEQYLPNLNGTVISVTSPLAHYQADLNLRSGDTVDRRVRAGNGAEAIAFWLGGFSSDPEHPISGPGGPWESIDNRNGLMDLDSSVLKDSLDMDSNPRRIAYTLNGTPYAIALQTYSPKGLKQPYVYFDTSRGLSPPGLSGSAQVLSEIEKYPVYVSTEGSVARALVRSTPSGLAYVQPKSFQILHAGTDDEWSASQPTWDTATYKWIRVGDNNIGMMQYPDGPFIREMADNLTNFSTGTLEDSQEEE